MAEYETLVKEIDKTLREVSKYSIGKIEQILERESSQKTALDENTVYAWRRLTLDICYDREYCHLLGVDYNTLPQDDINKVKVFALYLAKLDTDIVLPML